MPVNMSLDAHFRSTNYDGFVKGKPLTDARIRYYQRLGRYNKTEPYRAKLKKIPRRATPLSTAEMIRRLLH